MVLKLRFPFEIVLAFSNLNSWRLNTFTHQFLLMKSISAAIFVTYALLCTSSYAQAPKTTPQPKLGYRSVQLLQMGNQQFKDLNKNGRLDAYEDWRLPHEQRAKDLLSRMTVEQKVGFMLISTTRMQND